MINNVSSRKRYSKLIFSDVNIAKACDTFKWWARTKIILLHLDSGNAARTPMVSRVHNS